MRVLQDADGHSAAAESEAALEPAKSKGVTVGQLRKALGETLGADTALALARVDTSGAPPPPPSSSAASCHLGQLV